MIEMPGRFARGTEVRIREMGRGREGWADAGGHRRERGESGSVGFREDDGGWKDVKTRGDRGRGDGTDHS